MKLSNFNNKTSIPILSFAYCDVIDTYTFKLRLLQTERSITLHDIGTMAYTKTCLR